MSEALSIIVDYAWGLPLVFLLLGGGLLLSLYSKFTPLLGFKHSIDLIRGKHHTKKNAPGQITHFQALTNALSATIGLGNIGGVAVALAQGGPGAIFWMWVAAAVGANTKFFECSLALIYRGKDYKGEVQGGPMYVIERALPKLKPLAYFFAFCGLIGTMALFQVNQLAAFSQSHFSIPPLAIGVLSAAFVATVLSGGIKRIAQTTSALVPLMCVLYVLFSLVIIFNNFDKVPSVFLAIFQSAFSAQAAFGGAVGIGVLEVLKIGAKRAAFSNEAGVGTAPMAHGNAKTHEPISEGYVAMLGPFLDTIIVCTMTALVILLNYEHLDTSLSGVLLTTQAFELSFPGLGKYFIGISIFLFSITTMVGMANYNQKCWDFLFKGRFIFTQKAFIGYFACTLILGAIWTADDVVNILDIGYAFMAVPNMIATLLLAPVVKKELIKYNKKRKSQQT